MKCLKLANRLHLFVNVAITYVLKCKTCTQGHLVVPDSIAVSALVAADVTVANWLPSVQKPMGDDPVQSLQSDQFRHTPIPLSSLQFLPHKPKFSWRFISRKVLIIIFWCIVSPKRPTVPECIVCLSW